MSIITSTDIKTAMSKDDNEHDTLLGLIATQVQRIVETYCNRSFDQAAFTEYHDSPLDCSTIFLRNPPVDSDSAFTIYDDPDWVWGTGTLVPATDYRVDYAGGIVHYNGWFSEGNQSLKVTYTGGYAEASMPEDLEGLCIEMAILIFREQDKGQIGVPGRSFPDGSVSFSIEDLLPRHKMILDRKYVI